MEATVKHQEFDALIRESKQALKDYVEYKGIQYPMDEWVTITEYCKRFAIANTQTVTTWIQRGIVPSTHVVTIEELNHIRLIRAVPYRDQPGA